MWMTKILLAALALLCAGAASADARKQYLADREFCMSGKSWQDRKTCLREAAAAQQATRRGNLTEEAASYERNRLARCDRLQGDEHDYCLRRMRGEGTAKGSVEDGGIYRELTITVTGEEAERLLKARGR